MSPFAPMRYEVIMKVSALTASAVAIGLAAALAACSSGTQTTTSSGSPAASGSSGAASGGPVSGGSASAPASPAGADTSVPAGDQRVGGAGQGISFAVPATWVAVDLAKESVQQAAARIGLNGVSQSQVIQDMESLQKLHALFIVDIKSEVTSAKHFATNLNAYCVNSGLNDSGSAGVPLLRQETAAEFQQLHAGNISQKELKIGGVPGLMTSYTLSSSGAGTLEAAQLEVLPKAGRGCFVTLTAPKGAFPSEILPVVAATAIFP